MIKTATNLIRRFFASEAGPTAIEYAVLLALIISVCTMSIQMMGCQTRAAFQRASDILAN